MTVKETALRLRTVFAVPPTTLRRRPINDRDWAGLDTDGGASLEDERMPHGSLGHFGEGMGEPEGIRPCAMVSAARGDH